MTPGMYGRTPLQQFDRLTGRLDVMTACGNDNTPEAEAVRTAAEAAFGRLLPSERDRRRVEAAGLHDHKLER